MRKKKNSIENKTYFIVDRKLKSGDSGGLQLKMLRPVGVAVCPFVKLIPVAFRGGLNCKRCSFFVPAPLFTQVPPTTFHVVYQRIFLCFVALFSDSPLAMLEVKNLSFLD